MPLELFGHPFSSYTWKALIALYENDTPFTFRLLEPDQEENVAEHRRIWPIRRFPVLVDDGVPVFEASIVVEYLDLNHPGPVRFLPDDRKAALHVRMMDRFFDNYVMTPMTQIVFGRIHGTQDALKTFEAPPELLDRAYAFLDRVMAQRPWAAGEDFSLADCAAAPSLFYADWVHPIPEEHAHARAYRQRLLARPSVARAVDGGRPYRHYFPGGAPDRD